MRNKNVGRIGRIDKQRVFYRNRMRMIRIGNRNVIDHLLNDIL